MKRRSRLEVAWLGVIVITAALGCSGQGDTCGPGSGEPPGTTIYSNSFESASDTLGWHAHGEIELVDDAAPDGGSGCVRVSGGCYVPHALYRTEPIASGGYFTVRCWGLLQSGSGSVLVGLEGAESIDDFVGVVIDLHEWHLYSTPDKVWCPAGKRLEVWMVSGGFVPGAMLVDLLQLIRLEP